MITKTNLVRKYILVALTVVLLAALVIAALYFSPVGIQWRKEQQQEQQAQSYVGLTTAEAQEKAEADGLEYREIRKDGVKLLINADFRGDRINVSVSNEVVEKARFDGMERE